MLHYTISRRQNLHHAITESAIFRWRKTLPQKAHRNSQTHGKMHFLYNALQSSSSQAKQKTLATTTTTRDLRERRERCATECGGCGEFSPKMSFCNLQHAKRESALCKLSWCVLRSPPSSSPPPDKPDTFHSLNTQHTTQTAITSPHHTSAVRRAPAAVLPLCLSRQTKNTQKPLLSLCLSASFFDFCVHNTRFPPPSRISPVSDARGAATVPAAAHLKIERKERVNWRIGVGRRRRAVPEKYSAFLKFVWFRQARCFFLNTFFIKPNKSNEIRTCKHKFKK